MAVRVEQAGQQRAILAIEPPIGPPVLVGRGLFTLPDQLADLAIGSDGQPRKANDLSLVVEGDPVDVVDKAVGEGGRDKGEDEGDEKGAEAERYCHAR